MSKKVKPAVKDVAEITPRCEYCKHNEGENLQFGFMWKCGQLGYCVPFGYSNRHAGSSKIQYCKAEFTQRGLFALDREKYKEFQLRK